MLRSMRRFSETVTLKTSQKFLLPMLTHARVRGASFDESLTLAALFAAAPVAMLGGRWTYLQITAINNWMLERLRVRRSSKMHSAAAPLFDRLMAGWCSLSSADSPEIAMTLRADASADLLHLAARDDPTIMSKARAAAARIAELGPMIGARFLNFGMRLAPVGDGSHVGGTMPMSHAPEGPMATDRFGRPTGFERLFVVDASIFPTIPATTVALTVMANAHRIGSTAPLEA
jgi:choline dehydrogenase-like flavoprotein